MPSLTPAFDWAMGSIEDVESPFPASASDPVSERAGADAPYSKRRVDWLSSFFSFFTSESSRKKVAKQQSVDLRVVLGLKTQEIGKAETSAAASSSSMTEAIDLLMSGSEAAESLSGCAEEEAAAAAAVEQRGLIATLSKAELYQQKVDAESRVKAKEAEMEKLRAQLASVSSEVFASSTPSKVQMVQAAEVAKKEGYLSGVSALDNIQQRLAEMHDQMQTLVAEQEILRDKQATVSMLQTRIQAEHAEHAALLLRKAKLSPKKRISNGSKHGLTIEVEMESEQPTVSKVVSEAREWFNGVTDAGSPESSRHKNGFVGKLREKVSTPVSGIPESGATPPAQNGHGVIMGVESKPEPPRRLNLQTLD